MPVKLPSTWICARLTPTVLADAEVVLAQQRNAMKPSPVPRSLKNSPTSGLMPYHAAGLELAEEVASELDEPFQYIKTVAGHDSTTSKNKSPL